jgi:Ser/Thr protein kinase RdoA (MazF antagonist)
VLCHGDTHGFNNHVCLDAAGANQVTFFDFDDAGPGFLAYDLAVLPWSYLTRKNLSEPDDALRERWRRYVHAYRIAGGRVSERDLGALPMFLQLRHLWNLGEGLGRLHHWGANAFSTEWLRKQPDVMDAWDRIELDLCVPSEDSGV